MIIQTHLTQAQIIAGREEATAEFHAAKAKFEALLAYYNAAERLNGVMGVGASPEPQTFRQAPSAAEIAATDNAYKLLEKLKDKILLAVMQKNRTPSAIKSALVRVGAVGADYPVSHISPKLAAYRDSDLIEAGKEGWAILEAGSRRVLAAIQNKMGPDHAA